MALVGGPIAPAKGLAETGAHYARITLSESGFAGWVE